MPWITCEQVAIITGINQQLQAAGFTDCGQLTGVTAYAWGTFPAGWKVSGGRVVLRFMVDASGNITGYGTGTAINVSTGALTSQVDFRGATCVSASTRFLIKGEANHFYIGAENGNGCIVLVSQNDVNGASVLFSWTGSNNQTTFIDTAGTFQTYSMAVAGFSIFCLDGVWRGTGVVLKNQAGTPVAIDTLEMFSNAAGGTILNVGGSQYLVCTPNTALKVV